MNPRASVAWPGAPLAIGSAILFGASTPLAKTLLGAGIRPWLLAGLLYLGSGIGLGLLECLRRIARVPSREESLRLNHLPLLGLVVTFGGVIGPLLLMLGLQRSIASSASLLLNLEGIATMAIAWIVVRENVDRRLLIGAAAILCGAFLLSWQGGGAVFGTGSLAIAGACVAWGIDNNLTRKLSASNPMQIALAKGLVAGAVNCALAFGLGAHLPGWKAVVGAGVVGFFGYGVSLTLFVFALRFLGTARTGAYFSTAPFIGAILSVAILNEPLTARLIIAGVLMAIGVYFHLAERHEHEHLHTPVEHAHRHTHDEHHQHQHGPDDPAGEPHSHWHIHEPLRHSHAHYPDVHHRHEHSDSES